MNKRIKELAVQAGGVMFGELCGTLNFDTEKFAELIVKECVDKISQEQDIAEQNWRCKNGVHICHELTKHFGVEE